MSGQACSVGEGLSRAMARADELRESSPRKVRVRIVTRFGDLAPGVIVVASIAWKTGPELEAQSGKGVRYVPLAELDARAHELASLVDEAAAEVEAAVAAAPAPSLRPSQQEDAFDIEAYEDLIRRAHLAMLDATGPLVRGSVSQLSSAGVGEALAMAALQVASLSAVGGRIELADLYEMLQTEYRDIRQRAGLAPAQVH